MEQSLGIARTPEAMAQRNQAFPEPCMVIELAVVDDPALTVLVRHRLIARGGEIHDGKPTMAQPEITVEVKPFGVRSAVGQYSSHSDHKVAVDWSVCLSVMKYACNAAHLFD
jgi:hypothetical protein